MNLVSVIIPTHNYGHFISEAIDSVLKQTQQSVIIVVDDGSTDDTKKIVDQHKNICYVKLNRRCGTSKATNVGVRRTETPYFLCLGADDKLHPFYIKLTLKKMLKDPRIGLVFTACRTFGASSKIYSTRKLHHKYSVLKGTGGQLGAALTRREAYDSVGGYDESLNFFEDFDFAIRLSLKGWKLESVNCPLHFYRRYDGTRNQVKRRNALGVLESKYWFFTLYRTVAMNLERIELLIRDPRKFLDHAASRFGV